MAKPATPRDFQWSRWVRAKDWFVISSYQHLQTVFSLTRSSAGILLRWISVQMSLWKKHGPVSIPAATSRLATADDNSSIATRVAEGSAVLSVFIYIIWSFSQGKPNYCLPGYCFHKNETRNILYLRGLRGIKSNRVNENVLIQGCIRSLKLFSTMVWVRKLVHVPTNYYHGWNEEEAERTTQPACYRTWIYQPVRGLWWESWDKIPGAEQSAEPNDVVY